jgi:hypothetical protein
MSENHGAQRICVRTLSDSETESSILTYISVTLNKITLLLNSKVTLVAETQI